MREKGQYELYVEYLDQNRKDIEAGKDVAVEVRDISNYLRLVVRAQILKSPDHSPEADILWIRNIREDREPVPMGIIIKEELDEETPITAIRSGEIGI